MVNIVLKKWDVGESDQLVRFLARLFDVPRVQVELLAGHGSRSKRVRIRRPGRLPQDILPGTS